MPRPIGILRSVAFETRHAAAPLALLLAALTALAAGCGGRGGGTSAEPRCPHFTTAQVQRAFRAATGYRLRADPATRSAFGDRDLLRAVGGEAGFGRFTVVVVDERGSVRPASELDERGIAWQYSEDEGSWVATTRYGDNVFLSWLAGERQRTDARWARIDRALAILAPRVRPPG